MIDAMGIGLIIPVMPDLIRDRAQHEHWRSGLTVFDSTGWALEDLVALSLLREHASALDIGQPIQSELVGFDPKNPYDFGSPRSEPGHSPVNPRPGRKPCQEAH